MYPSRFERQNLGVSLTYILDFETPIGAVELAISTQDVHISFPYKWLPQLVRVPTKQLRR